MQSTSEHNLVHPDRRPRDPSEARGNLVMCLVGGAILVIVGMGILTLAGLDVFRDVENGTSTASPLWSFVGLVVQLVGGALLFVGLVGFGVKLGREASRV